MMDNEPGIYDLWMVWSNALDGYEKLAVGQRLTSEYRVYHRIPKRNIWHVGVREYKPRKSNHD